MAARSASPIMQARGPAAVKLAAPAPTLRYGAARDSATLNIGMLAHYCAYTTRQRAPTLPVGSTTGRNYGNCVRAAAQLHSRRPNSKNPGLCYLEGTAVRQTVHYAIKSAVNGPDDDQKHVLVSVKRLQGITGRLPRTLGSLRERSGDDRSQRVLQKEHRNVALADHARRDHSVARRRRRLVRHTGDHRRRGLDHVGDDRTIATARRLDNHQGGRRSNSRPRPNRSDKLPDRNGNGRYQHVLGSDQRPRGW